MLSCGPRAGQFVAEYPVDSAEEISDCNRGGISSTELATVTSIQIDPGEDTDLVLGIGPCEFDAAMISKGVFSVGRQTCVLDGNLELTVRVSADEAFAGDDGLELTLSGNLTAVDLGYQIDCGYSVTYRTVSQ